MNFEAANIHTASIHAMPCLYICMKLFTNQSDLDLREIPIVRLMVVVTPGGRLGEETCAMHL